MQDRYQIRTFTRFGQAMLKNFGKLQYVVFHSSANLEKDTVKRWAVVKLEDLFKYM